MANEALGAFLRDGTRRQREPGVWDCAGLVAEWVMANGYADPMAEWRGQYATDLEGEQLAERSGGLVSLFARGLKGVGVADAPGVWQPGDVAVVSLLGRQAGGLFTGQRWALVAGRGLGFASFDAECVLRVWRP